MEPPENRSEFEVKEGSAMRKATAAMSSIIIMPISAFGPDELREPRFSKKTLPTIAVLVMLATMAKMTDWMMPVPRKKDAARKPAAKDAPTSKMTMAATLPAILL